MATKGDQYDTVTGNIWNHANRGDESGVRLALERGVDVNLQNKVGWTAVHAAARGGQAKMIEFLASKGADLELTDNDGRLPVHEAARSGHLEALKALHRLGCSLAVETDGGQTVLQLAKGDAVKQYVRTVLASGDVAGSAADSHTAETAGSGAGNRQARGGGGGRGAAAGKPAWKKPAGAAGGGDAFSGKAKKEYLRWKREKKRQGGEETDSDAEETLSIPATRVSGPLSDTVAGDGGGGGGRDDGEAEQEEAGPVQAVEAVAARVERRERKPPPAGIEIPVEYAPLQDLPGTIQVQGVEVPARMPRCHTYEVGFTAEGRQLGMPKRPAWRGVVRSAAELHALEEQAFDDWQQHVGSCVEPGRVSFYEDRLEFWRQLWRVLDLCDVALMIVDARNPLLHFSEALASHILTDHRKPIVLVLNKADLVPSASVDRWTQWFTNRYPGLTVVPASAAPGSSEAASSSAPQIMKAIMECSVVRHGAKKTVGEVVGKSVDEVLFEARRRNTVAKRGVTAVTAPGTSGGGKDLHAKGGGPGSCTEGSGFADSALDNDGSEDDCDGAGWQLKGTKAKKVVAVRKKRAARMSQGLAKAQQQQQQEQQGKARGQKGRRQGQQDQLPGGECVVAGAAADRTGGDARKAEERKSRQGVEEEEDADHTTEQDSRAGGDTEGVDSELDEDNWNADLEQMEQDLLDNRDRHSEGEAGDEGDDSAAGDTAHTGTASATPMSAPELAGDNRGIIPAGAHAAAAARPAGQQQQQRQRRRQPVVVCVVGEPNVGKSSTMNALLGTHKVAVSSHPGRTKHYQTHYMSDQLMLCDCPGLVFPRMDVPLSMQVLYGSFPIARCRDPYSVIGYLAAHMWPRLHVALGLRKVDETGQPKVAEEPGDSDPASAAVEDQIWSPLELVEAYAAKKQWKSRKGGRLDVYRAANWILRAALAGKYGVCLAFLPPPEDELELQPQPLSL